MRRRGRGRSAPGGPRRGVDSCWQFELSNDATPRTRSVFAVLFAVVLMQALAGLVILQSIDGWPNRGDFGSMFGVTGSLFSGLALAGVVYAILLQRHELALQREELKLTRQELQRAAKAQEDSANLLREQLTMTRAAQEASMASRRRQSTAQLGHPRPTVSGQRAELVLTNYGPTIKNLEVRTANGVLHFTPKDVLPHGHDLSLALVNGFSQGTFDISYIDSDDQKREAFIEFNFMTNDFIFSDDNERSQR